MRKLTLFLAVAMLVLASAAGMAQTTTGTIRGRVVDAQGLALPGVTVNVTSPNLQGVRTVVTEANGDYIVAQLPPGTYTIAFELAGFETLTKTASVAPTQMVPVDVTMGVAGLKETVEVVGTTADVLTKTAQVATDFKQELIAALPTTRDLNASMLMAPAVSASGPSGQFTIAGSMSYDNLYMVNGVNVNENLRGQANILFIEDAIQETTVSTSGISAEFGRFGGGVVNVITKSGGNLFTGTFRDTLYNDNWRALTPYEVDHNATKVNKVVPTYEYTAGGPIMKDHIWFFTAGRLQDQQTARQLAITAVPYDYERNQKRFEFKGTYSPNSNHTFVANGSKISDKQNNDTYSTASSMDSNSLYNRETPQSIWSVNYNGIISPNFFLESRVSARHFTFIGSGSQYTDLIQGTLLLDRSRGSLRYWSPTFCGVCTPEKRDNQEVFAKGTYYLSTKNAGSHNMVFGYDNFDDIRFVNNHQSGSDWRIYGTSAIIGGDGTIYPQWLGDGSTYFYYQPILVPGADTNFRTHSVFYNDNWRVNDRFTVNAGLRWDKNHGLDSQNQLVAKDSAFSPRVGVVWDPTGKAQWSVTGSFAKYVTMINNGIANSGSAAGSPATYQWTYSGPNINPAGTPASQYVTSPQAIQALFNWFNANGGQSRKMDAVNLPGVATKIGGSLNSPFVYEYAGGVSRQIGQRGTVRLDGVYRKFNNFYATRTDTTTGTVTNSIGQKFDLSLIQNTDLVKRQYEGMTVSSNYRWPAVDVGGNYTLSRTYGNIDGETWNNGPVTSGILNYPEYTNPAWGFPEGDLSSDQRHRGSAWLNYRVHKVDGLTLSMLEVAGSGVPYGAVGPVDTRSYVGTAANNPYGYQTPQGASSQSYFFTARDAFRTDAYFRTDLAANYTFKIKSAGRMTELYMQAQVLNVWGQEPLCACGGDVFGNGGAIDINRIDTSVRTGFNNASYAKFNPMTTTPVQGTNWAKGPIFGTGVNRYAYQSPRTFRFSFGVRF